MSAEIRSALDLLKTGQIPTDEFKLEDGSPDVLEHYGVYVKRTKNANAEYILQHSDSASVSEFDALVDEYNNKILPAAELDEELLQQEGVKNGFITKAQAMLDKIKSFDRKVSVKSR